MSVIAIAVDKHDCRTANAAVIGALQVCARLFNVQWGIDIAIGGDAFVHFYNLVKQHFGLDDVAVKNFGPGLIADFQTIAEAFGGDQNRGITLALQQRVGGNCGAHFNCAYERGGDSLIIGKVEEMSDACHRCIMIGFRVFRQQLVRLDIAARGEGDDVGEGAATVNPEFPLGIFWSFIGHIISNSFRGKVALENI